MQGAEMEEGSGVTEVTELMDSAYYGCQDEVQQLLAQPGDAMATDSQGLNVLFYAVLGGHANIVLQVLNDPRAQELITSSAPGNISCLYLACQNGVK